MDLGSLLGNVASGGLIGLGGSIATQVIGMMQAKQVAAAALAAKQVDYAHDKEMAGINAASAAVAAAATLDLTKVQGDIDGLKASIADQTTLSGRTSQWVTDILALFRPGLTTVLVLGTGALALTLGPSATTSSPQAMAFGTVAEMAALAVTWWFGSRDQHKRRSL